VKILCRLGLHDWGYRAKNTGIYLHSYSNGSLPRSIDYYDKKRCWKCGKIEELNNCILRPMTREAARIMKIKGCPICNETNS